MGSMEIVSSTPERIDVRLLFEKPWKATNQVVFELTPSGATATHVAWRMSGTTTGFAALFSKLFSMDRMVGKDFEKGLARMKAAAESG
jgi:environmental stress-induced protein Ves